MESYYSVLGLSRTCSIDEIRRSYRNLAMQWHPDKWANNPAMLGEAKRKFQNIQEAYSVLSDHRKRTLYDAGMYDPLEEMDEGFCDFMQEMFSLMSQVRDEEKPQSMEDVQNMFEELMEGVQNPQWFSSPSVPSNQGCSGAVQQKELMQGFQNPQWFSSPSVQSNQGCFGVVQQKAESIRRDTRTDSSNFGMLGMSNYCR